MCFIALTGWAWLLISEAEAATCTLDPAAPVGGNWTDHPSAKGVQFTSEGEFSFELAPEAVERCQLHESRRLKEEDAGVRMTTDRVRQCARKRVVCFKAVRIAPELAFLDLVDVRATVDANPDTKGGIRRVVDERGQESLVPVQYTLESLMVAAPPEIPFAMSAGWNTGIDIPRALGYQIVNGQVLQRQPEPSLSAIVCLNDTSNSLLPQVFSIAQFGKFSYASWSTQKKEAFSSCRSAIQVGPRIIEYNNEEYVRSYKNVRDCLNLVEEYIDVTLHRKLGICESSLNRPLRVRTVLALAHTEDGKDYIYALITTNPVSLYALQMLFLNWSALRQESIEWAVNLAGDKQASFYFRATTSRIEKAGNPSRALATALVLKPR